MPPRHTQHTQPRQRSSASGDDVVQHFRNTRAKRKYGERRHGLLDAFRSGPWSDSAERHRARGAVRGEVERRAVERRLVQLPRSMSCQVAVLLAECAAAALA
jgi:hypothetical protein